MPAVQPSSPQQQSLQQINHFCSAVDPTVQASSAGFSVNSDKKENGYISCANVFGGGSLGSAMTAFKSWEPGRLTGLLNPYVLFLRAE